MTEKEFQDLILANYGEFRTYIGVITRNQSEADDIMQDVLIRAWSKIDFINTDDNFKSLIMKMAEDAVKDKRRKLAVHGKAVERLTQQQRLQHKELVDEVLIVLVDIEERCLVVDALRQLRKSERAILGLYYYHEKTLKDISELLGMKYTTVRDRRTRALKKLKKILEKTNIRIIIIFI